YIYLSNEGEELVDVFFDDLKVTHTKSPVVQQDDYYPFGLEFNSYRRENSTPNQYQFNGKEFQDELDVNWSDYGARMYMANLGRFMTKDRASGLFHSVSPYAYGGNAPTSAIDHNGDYIIFVNGLTQVFGREVVSKGKGYWGLTTQALFKSLFNGSQNEDYASFANGESESEEWSAVSLPSQRYEAGYNWAAEQYNAIIQAYEAEKLTNPAATLNLVSHSQGAAFAEGVAALISERSEGCYKVNTAVHLQPSSPLAIEAEGNTVDTRIAVYTFGDLVANKYFEWMKNTTIEIRERKIFGKKIIQHKIFVEGQFYNTVRYRGSYNYKDAHGLNYARTEILINSILVGLRAQKNPEWKPKYRKF